MLAADPYRLLRGREIGMPVDIGETDWSAVACTEQCAEHDAAVAPEQQDEVPVVHRRRHARGERAVVDDERVFVSDAFCWTNEVLIRPRRDIAKIRRAQPADESTSPQCCRRAIEVPRLAAIVVRTNADVRGSANDGNGFVTF